MDPCSNVRDLAHVAELLRSRDRFVIVPHVQPDPDAYGSAFGLALLLEGLGKTTHVYHDEPVPVGCQFLTAYHPVHDTFPPDLDQWAIIFVDGGERKRQPEPVRDLPVWLNLDHHEGNDLHATWVYSDTGAAATSEIVARLNDALGAPLTAAAASCLYAGILFDTRSGFITDRCTAALYRLVADLVAAGAKPDAVNRAMNEQMSMGDFRLYGAALAGLRTAMDGKVVYTGLSRAMFVETGGTDQAMEMLTLNLPKIAGGEIFALFRELEDGTIKVSLRSKGRVAVNAVAKQFEGGGHRFAAGARSRKGMAEAQADLIAACEAAITEALGATPQ